MMIDYENSKDGFVKINIKSNWEYIPMTREFIANFLSVKVIDKNLISNATIVAEELLENAVRFSSFNGINFQINKNDNDSKIIIKITNYSNTKNAEDLLLNIDEINNSKDKLELYVTKLKNFTKDREKNQGVGLSRISYENKASIYVNYKKIDNNLSIVEVVSSIAC